jgi:hypothetical protein
MFPRLTTFCKKYVYCPQQVDQPDTFGLQTNVEKSSDYDSFGAKPKAETASAVQPTMSMTPPTGTIETPV